MGNLEFANNINTLIKCTKEVKGRLQTRMNQETERHQDEYHKDVMELDKEYHKVCMAELLLLDMQLHVQENILKEIDSGVCH